MSIVREAIDPDADKVVRRLRRHGHAAYLVGGCVRDLLVGRRPKDFDVATSATPQEIKDVFRNCRIIGRRFRLAHVFFGAKIIETATFRTNPREGLLVEDEDELLIRRDNVFGTAEEDARRRDFTINGLFYDVEAGEVIDYVGGLADLAARTVRTIGDPDIRFREDPVRILRAIKFAARLDFSIEPATYDAILAHRDEIPKCAPPRVLEEVYRVLRGGAAKASMELLLRTGVAATLAPELVRMFGDVEAGGETTAFGGTRRREQAWRLLTEIDALVHDGLLPDAAGAQGHMAPTATRTGDGSARAPLSNALLVGALVAPFLPADGSAAEGHHDERTVVVDGVLRPLVLRLRISRRDAERTRQILLAQHRLAPARRRRARPMALLRREHFLEALTLYELVSRSSGQDAEEVARWQRLLSSGGSAEPQDGEPKQAGVDGPEGSGARTKRRRRRGGRRRRRSDAAIGTEATVAEGEPERLAEAPRSPADRDP